MRADLNPGPLAEALGRLVLASSEAEGQIGEMLTLVCDLEGESAPKGWWASGAQLADSIKKLGRDSFNEIEAEYRSLFPQRNICLHAQWYVGSSESGMILGFHRAKDKGPAPGYGVIPLNLELVKQLAERYLALTDLVDSQISELMGLKPPAN